MTTFAPANPLDFARADFSTFTVPHPVRAAVVDSLIKENRANTPLSAINERKSPRITVSELNDMDMDEIKQRFYNTGIDTRGPVTKFLDIIDLPRNALFNLAAGDTARRKSNMGDNAAFGLARVNTSDVLESLGVRPGLASGILGFMGDVALDPLTYVGPAGWGAKAASKAGRTVSYTRQGTKVLREAVDAVKAGRTASSPAVAKYLETLGHTAESIAAHPDKIKLATDVERTLLGGKQTRFNKVMSAFGEDAEKAAVENARTIADDIADYANFKNDIVAKDAATNARVAAAKDVYKEIGRPFSKGVRFYKDATKPMGIGMTTSRDMAHGSGILHVPFTDIQVSVPSFTPFAAQQGLVANLTKNGVGNFDESKVVNGIKPVVEELDNRWHNYQQEREAYDSIIQSTAAGVDDVVQTPDQAHREFLDYAYGPIDSAGTRTGGAVSQMAKILEEMQADPMTSYPDMLHAQDVFKAYAARAQIARDEYQRAKEVVTETGEFAAAVDEDVTTIVGKDIEGLRKTQRDENMRRAAVKSKVPAVIGEIDNEYAQHVQARRDANPAIKSDVDEAFGGFNKTTTGISKAKLGNFADPAFYDTATQEWKDLRYTPPGQERNNLSRLAVGDSQNIDITESMYPDGVVPDDVERVYDTVQRQDADILNDFVSKENQAFTGLQVGLKESGRFAGNVAKIDLAKVQPNDVWFMGDAQVKVVGVNPIDGTVDLEVLMPPENVDVTTTVVRPSEKTRGKKTKTTRQRTPTSVESQERPRYYTVSVDQTPFASKAAKKSEKVTVERLDDMGELDLFEPEPALNRETAQSMALERLGVTPEDLADARLGQGTEYDGLDEMSMKERLVAKRLDEQRAKMNAREDGAVPLYLNKAERTDRSAYADYLHAKANAAQSIADASMTPYLATIGSDNKAAVEAVRDAWGLGADDLGSGIMQSVVSATNKYSPNNKYGQKAINEAQALERFFVNKMGLPPGIANDMVKQAAKSANVADTVAFKTAVADITRTLTDAGVSPAELTEANDLAMALLFAGDEPIEALIARGDIAGEMIQKALTSGILQDPNKAKAIRSVVDKYRAIFAKLDDGTGIANYAPNVLTPQAKNIIDYQRRNRMNIIGARKRGETIPVTAPEKMTESFEKKRSTIEHAWRDADNNEIKVMESELAYLYFTPQDLQAYAKNPEYLKYLQDRIEHAKLYSQLTEADKLTKVKSYYLSPMEINRRVTKNGMFNTLTNNALNGNDFMHSNFTAAVAARLGSQERKYANELLQQYLAPHALRLNEIELAQAGEAAGKAVDMKTVQGTPVTLVNEGGKKTIYLGNKKYKQPDIDISSDFSPLKSIFTTPSGKPIANEFYPEEIADIIDDTAGFFSDKATGGMAKAFGEADAASRMTAILKGADTLSGYWKVLTLLHPSWTINDIIGNLFFMANMGINPATAIKNAKPAFKMLRANAAGDREVLREMMVKGRSAADHFDDALGQTIGSHQAADATMHLRQSGETIEPFNTSIGSMLNKTVRGDFAGAKAEGRQMVSESWQAAGKTIDNQNVDRPFATQAGKAVKQPINALFQQGLIRRVWQPWAHLNGMANDWLKVTAYLSLLDDGYDATSAARLISEKMLDMSVLTSTDRSARRFVPFYNWMKNSGVLGAREFLRNPKFFSIAPKVKHALEESFNGEQNLPENARPSWIRDQLALQIGTDMDTRRALTLTSSLPTEAATYGLSFLFSPFMGAGALQDSLAYGINSLTPAVKIPLELGSRREFFTKRTIDAQGGDITPGEYLTQQIRPFRELGIGSLRGGPLQRAFSDSPVMGISRALVGGRLQPFDEERRVQNLQREYDDRVDALRRRIGIAERETQKEESLRRRTELLQLFNQMQKLGLTIPKWASGQIEGLSVSPTAN